MRFWKIAAISLILTMSTGLAAASPAEMTIFPQESSAEINSFTSFEITVENTGNVEDVYTLQPDVEQVTVAPQEIRLDPGEQETVHAWYNPDDTQEADTYSFEVTATSRATGERYSVGGFVNVITDHEVNLNINDASRTVCRGEVAQYNIQVTNDGIQTEEFSLSTPVGQLSQDTVELEPGETEIVALTVSSDEATDRSFNVLASSTTSYAENAISLNFEAETCYASDVSIEPESQEVGAFTEAEYEIVVENTGTRTDEFTLSTDIEEMEEDTVTIEGGSSETVTLFYVPEELGTHELTVTAEGMSQSSATATAEAYNAMDLDLQFDSESRSVCENEEASYIVNIRNTGEVTETYTLETDRGELSATEGELAPGELGQAELVVDTTELETGETYDVQVEGTATTFGEPSATADSELSVENCWDLEMDVIPERMSAGENRSVIYEIQLDNTGTRENTYQLSYQGPDWISIRPEEVTVAPGNSETAYMYAGIPFEEEGEVGINVTAEGEQVSRTDSVTLLIDEELQEYIEDGRDLLTGRFTEAAAIISDRVRETTDIQRAILSVIVGLVITLAVLYSQ